MDPIPGITAPVMRFIGIADISRSIAFYRDVLGFEIREQDGTIEATYGPARIRFSGGDQAAAILFFQTADVAAMHAAIQARGGNPSGIEKVNWIKMQMFEARDPDAHTLWFGQSYDSPDRRAPAPLLRKIMPALPVSDVPGAIAHYRDVLGFSVNYQHHDLGVMDRDEVTLLLIARTDRHQGIGSAYVYVENADVLYAELREKGANVQGEPVSHPWGLREFTVLDPESNEIKFGQPFE